MAAKRIIVRGTVQGVFFRVTAKKIAEDLGITGWVFNTSSGDVEAFAQGSDAQVDAFVEWCRIGPKQALVTDVLIESVPENTCFGFQIK